jgi:sugar lactone lactonase YvrE
VYRVNPNGAEVFLTDADVWASGFNPITAIGFQGGGLYVTEYATQDSGYATGDVIRVQVKADGSAGTRRTLGAGALHEPNGLAFDADGKVHVSNYSISAGGGQVVRINY